MKTLAEFYQRKLPDDGVYYDLPFIDYLKWFALSSSTVKHGLQSQKRVLAAMLGQIRLDSTAKTFGRAEHTAVLEGIDEFESRHPIRAQCAAVTRAGKGPQCTKRGTLSAAGQWYCSTKGHAPADAFEIPDSVTESEADRIRKSADAIRSSPAGRLFDEPGQSEVSCVWHNGRIVNKARLDRLTFSEKIIDLKTCESGSADETSCRKTIGNYRYDIQAAMYVEAVQACCKCTPEFYWVFAEKGPPYDVNVLRASQAMLDVGRMELERLRGDWSRAVISGDFPGVMGSAKVIEVDPPDWLTRESDHVIAPPPMATESELGL